MTASVLISIRVKGAPERAFDVFTKEIGNWWRPDPLFMITPRGDGTLAFEGGPGGRLVANLPSGNAFEIGRITEWKPGVKLGFGWRHATFAPEQVTHVEVEFEPVGEETRVTVTHYGWTDIPREHAARHGFPDAVTQLRAAEWWRRSLDKLNALSQSA